MKTAATPPKAKRSQKAASPPGDANQTPIGISPDEGEKLRRCADKCGQSVADFVRGLILDASHKLDALDPLAMPCPFCLKTDELEIRRWSQERRDGTEYDGDAVRCHRCEAIATMAAWIKRGLKH